MSPATESRAEIVPAGWSARLNIGFERRDIDSAKRSVMAERSHFGPLRILKPLYPEGEDICHGVIVHPPGGIVAGDQLSVDVRVNSGANALITTPGAQKWYRSAGKLASAVTRLHVADDASLEWLPQETMVFNGARAQQTLEISLAADARFFGWEMLCLGRTTRGERFDVGQFRQRIELVRAETNAPLWRESMVLNGDDALLVSPLGMRGHPVLGTAWMLYPQSVHDGAALLGDVREALGEQALAAASMPEPGLIVVKVLGDAPETVRNLLIAVWRKMRSQVIGREAVVPRIWST